MTSLKSLYKRNAPLFIISGALVIFLTFIVRDVISDRVKDAASSLKAAQIEYNASVRDDAFRASLDSIQETVNLLLNDERMSKEKASSRALVALGPHYLDTWNDAHYFVDQAVAFASRTDGAEQEAQKLTQLSKDLYASKDRNEQRTLASLKCSVKSYRDSLSNAQGVDILNLVDETLAVASTKETAEEALARVLQVAKDNVKREERYEAWARWVGYLLFPVGWVLGLIGSLVKNEAPSGE